MDLGSFYVLKGFNVISGRIGSSLCSFKSFKNNITLNCTNNYQTTCKYYEKKVKPIGIIIWLRRIMCSLIVVIVGIYCACNGINQLLMGNKLSGWLLLF